MKKTYLLPLVLLVSLGLASCNPGESSNTNPTSSYSSTNSNTENSSKDISSSSDEISSTPDSSSMPDSSSSEEKEPVEISIKTPEKTTLEVDETLQLTAETNNAESTMSITWASSSNDIASVSSSGLVTALKEGTTQITATIGDVTSSPLTLTVLAKSTDPTVNTVLSLLRKADSLEATSLTGGSLSIMDNIYYSGTLTNSIETKNDVSLFSDNLSQVTRQRIQHGLGDETDSVLENRRYTYGEAHDRFIRVVENGASDGTYTINTLQTRSQAYVDSVTDEEKEIVKADALTLSQKGEIEGSKGLVSYLIDSWFDSDNFLQDGFGDVASITVSNETTYTIEGEIEKEDSYGSPLDYRYDLTFTFNTQGYLSKAEGGVEIYNNDVKASEKKITLEQTFGTRSLSSEESSLERLFFTSLDLYLSLNNVAISEVQSPDLGRSYYVLARNNETQTALLNVDNLQIKSITKNGETASSSDYTFVDGKITFLEAGEYSITFSTAKTEKTISYTLEKIEVNSVDFAAYGRYTCSTYLPGAVFIGEEKFGITYDPSNAPDDSVVELKDNSAGATIRKDSDFNYTLKTTQAGSVTVSIYSASLGIDSAIEKVVKVYENTDENINNMLTENTWQNETSYATLKDISFTKTGSNTGTFSATYSGSSTEGNYTISDGVFTVEATSTTNKVTAIAFADNNKHLTVTHGRGFCFHI